MDSRASISRLDIYITSPDRDDALSADSCFRFPDLSPADSDCPPDHADDGPLRADVDAIPTLDRDEYFRTNCHAASTASHEGFRAQPYADRFSDSNSIARTHSDSHRRAPAHRCL